VTQRAERMEHMRAQGATGGLVDTVSDPSRQGKTRERRSAMQKSGLRCSRGACWKHSRAGIVCQSLFISSSNRLGASNKPNSPIMPCGALPAVHCGRGRRQDRPAARGADAAI
jgi:hypothetical protein